MYRRLVEETFQKKHQRHTGRLCFAGLQRIKVLETNPLSKAIATASYSVCASKGGSEPKSKSLQVSIVNHPVYSTEPSHKGSISFNRATSCVMVLIANRTNFSQMT